MNDVTAQAPPDSVALPARPRRPWPSTAVDLGFLAIIPVATLLVLRVSPFFRLNNGDPFIYVGYSNDFTAEVNRFGYTYHAVRFGLIFPLRLSLVFGPIWGYFILRYALYQLALVPLFFAVRPHGRVPAFATVLFFVANPVTAQAILSTYSDFILVPLFAAIGALFVIGLRQSGWRWWACAFGAGLGVGWAFNTNVSSVALAGVMTFVVGFHLLRRRRVRDLVIGSAVFVAGAFMVCLLGVVVYWRLFHDPNIYETSINAVRELSKSPLWRAPDYSWLAFRRYIYAPLFVLIFALAVWWRTARSGVRNADFARALALAASSIGLFYLQEFVLQGTSLEQAYYFSWLMGSVCLLYGLSVALARRYSVAWSWVLLLLPVVCAWSSQMVDIDSFVLFAVVGAVLVIAAISVRQVAVAAAVTVAAVHMSWASGPRVLPVIAPGYFQYDPHYETVFGTGNRAGFDAYAVASRLNEIVPKTSGAQPPLLFWYPTGDALLDSVQATYLWETSAVQRRPEAGLPTITADDLARLRTLTGGYVAMLARNASELDAGQAALSNAGLAFSLHADRRFSYGDSTVFARVLAVTGVPPTP